MQQRALKVPTDRSAEPHELLRFTTRAIEHRARVYRNTVIAVVSVLVLSLVSALVFWSWRPLVGWTLTVPLTALFLWLDARLVRRWQEVVLQAWAQGALDLNQFRRTVTGMKHLPAATLTGMFNQIVPAFSAGSAVGPRSSAADVTLNLATKARAEERSLIVSWFVLFVAALCVCAAVVQRDRRLSLLASVILAGSYIGRLIATRASRPG